MTVTNSEIGAFIHAQTEDTTPDTTNDELLTYDDSASAVKRVKLNKVGGGAPSTAKYITSAADAGLSAEIVIPGLAGSPDIAGAGGSTFADEWDSATTGLTWDTPPSTIDSNTTVLSHLYCYHNANATITGLRAFAPAGAFDARTKVAFSSVEQFGTNFNLGFEVQSSDGTKRVLMWVGLAAANPNPQMYTYDGSYSAVSSTYNVPTFYWDGYFYLRMTRGASNDFKFYYSKTGVIWQYLGAATFTITIAKIGYRWSTGASGSVFVADWMRAS